MSWVYRGKTISYSRACTVLTSLIPRLAEHARSLSETRDEKQTFFNAYRVTRKFPARRSFALEQLSTNTKSTQHQTAELSEGPSSLRSIFAQHILRNIRIIPEDASLSRYVSIGVPGKISNKYTTCSYCELRSSISFKIFTQSYILKNKIYTIFLYNI